MVDKVINTNSLKEHIWMQRLRFLEATKLNYILTTTSRRVQFCNNTLNSRQEKKKSVFCFWNVVHVFEQFIVSSIICIISHLFKSNSIFQRQSQKKKNLFNRFMVLETRIEHACSNMHSVTFFLKRKRNSKSYVTKCNITQCK